MDMHEYVKEQGIRVEILEDFDYQRDEDGWEHRAFNLRLHRGQRSLTTKWRQGLGIHTSPDETPAEILNSLVWDAASYADAEDFEDFASSLGYDCDSRKAEKVYRECGKLHKRLVRFLGGDEEFQRVAYDIERL
jgi:hypothetical protein